MAGEIDDDEAVFGEFGGALDDFGDRAAALREIAAFLVERKK